MPRCHAIAVSEVSDDYSIHPINGKWSGEGFDIEAVRGGYRCYGDGFDFTCRLDVDTGDWYVDAFGRLIWPDVYPNVDLAIVVYPNHIALQKVVNGPGINSFDTLVTGVVPDWMIPLGKPEAIENFYGDEKRLTEKDTQRGVVCGEETWEDGDTTYFRHWFKDQSFKIDPRTRIKSLIDGVVYPIRLHTLFSLQLTVSTDKAQTRYEKDDTTLGGDYIRSVDTGHHNSTGQDRIGGIIFDMSVPQGATVSDATLTLANQEAGFGSLTITVYGDDDLTQTDWGSTDRPSQATKTTASGAVIDPTNTKNSSWTVDVTSVVQEIVDDVGWSSGDAIRFILEHNATSGYNIRFPTSAANYATAGQEPQLDVNYTTGGATVVLGQRPMTGGMNRIQGGMQ